MTPKKQREKNRRRANRLAGEAWQAAEDARVELAVKIIRRAVDLNPSNPALWHDQGSLLVLSGQHDDAASSFEAAIQLAPEFAQAYADLAALRARQGMAEQAVGLQREAVRHAQHPEQHQKLLAAYEALLAARPNLDHRPRSSHDSASCLSLREKIATFADGWPDLAATMDGLNWMEIECGLTERGFAHIPQLLRAERCATLRMMFDDDVRFAKTVTMDKNRFGRGVYRYFAPPIPPLVDAIRQLAYPHLAKIANRWQHLLAREEQYPATWPAFRQRCAAEGQTTPSPLMLRYEAGGFNALHQDIRGEVFFPVQLVIVLSERTDTGPADDWGFTGGEFLFCDQPRRKPSDRRAVPAGLGDAVFFCTRSRLMRVGGVYGLQPVQHGLDRVESGVRYALGVPFHEFC